jgi:hypothetical protein
MHRVDDRTKGTLKKKISARPPETTGKDFFAVTRMQAAHGKIAMRPAPVLFLF